MSLLPKDTISIIAQSAGIQSISDDIASHLAPDVEYRLRDVIETASKFMRHSKRGTLTTEDINNALKVRNIHPLYGFSSPQELRFRKASEDLFYIEDKEVDLIDMIKNPMKDDDISKTCPLDASLSSHWLSVEGIQPMIPENPSLIDPEDEEHRQDATWKSKQDVELGDDVVTMNVSKYHKISMELEKYFNDIISIVRKDRGKESSQVLREEAIKSLTSDAGIHQLVPYFSQFIADEVVSNFRNLELEHTLMRMVKALLLNPHVHIELYLHQLLPPVITCLLAKKLGENPFEDHWSLRDYAASVIAFICSNYGESYRTLQPRITKTLLRIFLDIGKPLTTHYGAIVGLTALGPNVFKSLLMPNVRVYSRIYEPSLVSKNIVKQGEAIRCYYAMMAAVGNFMCKIDDFEFIGKLPEEFFSEDSTRQKRSSGKGARKKLQIEKKRKELRNEEEEELTNEISGIIDIFWPSLITYCDYPCSHVVL